MAAGERGSMNKYRNKKTAFHGILFDSKREAERYAELCLLVKAGEIKDLVLQPQFELQGAFKLRGKIYRPIIYIADFQYTETVSGKVVVEDVKGMETETFRLKKKLFLRKYGEELDFCLVR